MIFYNRNTEILELRKLSNKYHSGEGGLMTIVVGRRRVGKTRLLREVYQGHNNFYGKPQKLTSICLNKNRKKFDKKCLIMRLNFRGFLLRI
jgi:hypothetical protein